MTIHGTGRKVKLLDPPARKRGGTSLDQAIWAANLGWAVLEIVPGSKKPARRWKDLGYRSPETLRKEWWGHYNVGVMTGPSDLVDVESDGPHGEPLLYDACRNFPEP